MNKAMKKYKIQIDETKQYAVDVLANGPIEAEKLAIEKFNELKESGVEHYNEVSDSKIESHIFDITNTDDPFNP